jgi:single-stranded-DNA-specific exonuclease
MASHTLSPPPFAPVLGVAVSLSGKAWRWRGGNMELDEAQAGGPHGLNHAILDQLLLTRGVAEDDLARHAQPTIRAFLPDPSTFRDMDAAADRLAPAASSTGERVTIYGDYDVDGATSAALLGRNCCASLALAAGYYIPDRLLEGYGPSGAKRLVELGRRGSESCRDRRLRRDGA